MLEINDENRELLDTKRDAVNTAYKAFSAVKSSVREAQHKLRDHNKVKGSSNKEYNDLALELKEATSDYNSKQTAYLVSKADLEKAKSDFGKATMF